MRAAAAAFVFVTVLGAGGPRALAQAATDVDARQVFELGRRAYEDERYEEAVRYFQRAYDLSHRGELQYNIGSALERAGHPAEAVVAFEEFLELVPDTDRRAEVQERLEVLRATQASSADTPAPTDATAPADTAAPADDGGSGPGVAPFIVLGAGVAVAAAGVVLLVLAQSAKGTVEGSPDGTSWLDVSGDAANAETFGVVGAILLGVGAAATAGGLVWWIAGGSGSDDEPSASVSIVPGGAVLRGAF